jgi:hypothetical protein
MDLIKSIQVYKIYAAHLPICTVARAVKIMPSIMAEFLDAIEIIINLSLLFFKFTQVPYTLAS